MKKVLKYLFLANISNTNISCSKGYGGMKMNKIMKIGSGMERVDGETREVTAYVSKCSTSLTRLLEDNEPVTIKAMGNRAIANVMKVIARVNRNLPLKLEAPVFVDEQVGESTLAVFNITVTRA